MSDMVEAPKRPARVRKNVVRFVLPPDVDQNSEVGKLYVLWGLLERCPYEQALRMVKWGLSRLREHKKEDQRHVKKRRRVKSSIAYPSTIPQNESKEAE